MKKRLIILLLYCFFASTSYSQQLPRYSQYIMNEFIINPAVAGVDGRTTLNLTGRKEWIGFGDGLPTPSTYSFSAQTRILKKSYSIKKGIFSKRHISRNRGRVGLGANIFNDRNGAINRTGVQLTYAYHIFIRNSQLSFGLSGLGFQFKISPEYAEVKNPDDPLVAAIGKSTFIPDAAFGINFMTTNYHFGLSVSQIFESKIKLGNNSDFKVTNDIIFNRNFYFIGSYRDEFYRNRKWEYEPTVIVQSYFLENTDSKSLLKKSSLKTIADISVNFIYKKEYWASLGYRTVGDIILMIGMKMNHYYLTYSVDYGFNGITRYTFGSHEITLSAKFGDSARRYRWLERY